MIFELDSAPMLSSISKNQTIRPSPAIHTCLISLKHMDCWLSEETSKESSITKRVEIYGDS